MPPSTGCPDENIRRAGSSASLFKPPLPTLSTSLSRQGSQIEIQLPPLIAGALVAAFAQAVAEGLGNELLTHYYLTGQKVRINLDRVLDRLLADFVKELWDELFHFYHNSNTAPPRQVILLFDGPIRQIVLILNGPETSSCLLDKLAPGLSRRKPTWSAPGLGIDLLLALQLSCSYWHREHPALSPGGSPHAIAQAIHARVLGGRAASHLVASIRKTLMGPDMVQMHLIESAVWDIVMKRPFPPPSDGFGVVQLKFECQLPRLIADPQDSKLVNIGSLTTITGNVSKRTCSTVSDYVAKQWPRTGQNVLGCLQQAVSGAHDARARGDPFAGMAIWDSSDGQGEYCPGLRLLHIEVESSCIRMSVSAWTHTLVNIFQQMAWTCAALSASPFSGSVSESTVEVSSWQYQAESIYIDCGLSHRPVPASELGRESWLQQRPGATIASGFPLYEAQGGADRGL
ncbi:hypothetical protein S40293_00696 [Stachybotrys chartarum IBT 40293]|nr:hypothetical protein S40293_00696 [Stachybotrys chartarum IBT 40293]